MVSRISPEDAASELDRKFRSKKWYISVGVGETERGAAAIFLYVKNANHRDLANLEKVWMGYQLIVESIGSVRPAWVTMLARKTQRLLIKSEVVPS
jgi:hypothetical protein